MPKLNEGQDRNHPWFKKHARAAEDKERKTTLAPKEKQGCVQCGDFNCEFGECDGRDF